MTLEVRLPALGSGIKEAFIQFWELEEGDHVTEGENLVEITFENESIPIPSPFSGVLQQIVADEGDIVEVGDLLAIIKEKSP